MSSRVSFALFLLLTLSWLGSAANLCPQVNSDRHAEPQQWVFSNLNWTLTNGEDTIPPTPGRDLVRVSFDIKSDFNNASVRCVAEAPEFGEEYIRDARGQPVDYHWYNCVGTSEVVDTQFQVIWWNDHTVELNQTWTCEEKAGALIPYRATGKAVMLGTFDCVHNPQSQARLRCIAYPSPRDQMVIPAEIVQVLPAPPRDCAAKSVAKPDWKILNFKWFDNFTPDGYPWSVPQQNISFQIINEALDYSPLMSCEVPDVAYEMDWSYSTWYPCTVFESYPGDAPVTEFNWRDRGTKLSIRQSWWCDDGPAGRTTFKSVGTGTIGTVMDCTYRLVVHDYFNETMAICNTRSDLQIKGTLQ